MKSPGSAILGLLLLAGCTPLTSANPLGTDTTVAAGAPCVSRYSFEDGDLSQWSAPSWTNGNRGMIIDSVHAYCGTRAIHMNMELVKDAKKGLLSTNFSSPGAVTAAPWRLRLYFEGTPPANVKVTVIFTKPGGWATSTAFSSLASGWNTLSGTVTAPLLDGFQVQFESSTTNNWSGDVWVDEINW